MPKHKYTRAENRAENRRLREVGFRRCRRGDVGCLEIKPLSSFWKGQTSCKDCQSAFRKTPEERAKARESTRKSYRKHKAKRQAAALEYKSGTPPCPIDGCPNQATTRAEGSMCDKHRWRLKHWGTTDDSGAMDRTGPNCYNWAAEISYTGLHDRIFRYRGKAADYECVDGCGRQAKQWSYNHEGGADERHGPNSQGYVMAYSLNIYAYEPRCMDCHYIYDAEHARSRELVA